MVKRAARIHLPPGVLLMLTVVALLLMLFPFRMPPLSRSKSLAYSAWSPIPNPNYNSAWRGILVATISVLAACALAKFLEKRRQNV